MHYTHKTQGTCSTKIEFDIEDNRIHNVTYTGGCNGNLKALGALVEGMDCSDVVKRLRGITCGFKSTSCSDQLAQAIEKAIKQ